MCFVKTYNVFILITCRWKALLLSSWWQIEAFVCEKVQSFMLFTEVWTLLLIYKVNLFSAFFFSTVNKRPLLMFTLIKDESKFMSHFLLEIHQFLKTSK